jgi:hypothetical protein
VRLRGAVLRDLERHGIAPAPGESPAALKERLNERYLEAVRELRRRQAVGEIALRDYAGHVQALKDAYPLLGLPLTLWTE